MRRIIHAERRDRSVVSCVQAYYVTRVRRCLCLIRPGNIVDGCVVSLNVHLGAITMRLIALKR